MVGKKERNIGDGVNNIAIIGFMATGKSSVGLELAKSLELKFIDIDEHIEANQRKPISQIFKDHGEEYFRGLESELIKEISQSQGVVISCGGGICLNPENIKTLGKKNKVILLEASADDIIERTKNDRTRPLLGDKDKKKAIEYLMNKRRKQYLKSADIVIDTSGKDIATIRDEIVMRLEAEAD